MARSVGILTKLNLFLPQKALLNLYYSLIHSQFYTQCQFGVQHTKHISLNVKRLQNIAIRAVTKTKYTESITPQYKILQILKLDDLFIFEIAKLMYLLFMTKCLIDLNTTLRILLMYFSTLHVTPRQTSQKDEDCEYG